MGLGMDQQAELWIGRKMRPNPFSTSLFANEIVVGTDVSGLQSRGIDGRQWNGFLEFT